LVENDPENPEDRIGSVVAQAESGDTILVEPGLYYEHIPVGGKSLTFVGIAGPDQTVLSGERPFEGREGGVLYTETGNAGQLSFRGLTFRDGRGSRIDHNTVAGGALACWSDFWSGELVIEECHFIDNVTDTNGLFAEGGGAVFASYLYQVRISNCEFSGNWTDSRGGAVLCFGSETTAVIEGCWFAVSQAGFTAGAAVYAEGPMSLTIQDCDFEGVEAGFDYLYGIQTSVTHLEVVGNRFRDTVSSLASKLMVSIGGIGNPEGALRIADNVFIGDVGTVDMEEEILVLMGGEIQLQGNTFAGCNIQIEGGGDPIDFSGNIVYMGFTDINHFPGGTIGCNDFWPDSVSLGWGDFDFERNIFEDPLFCEPELGDYRIAWESPCSSENAPEGCGRIGALPEACHVTAVQVTTWGRIKTMYRGR
jgi:hypothetical protein